MHPQNLIRPCPVYGQHLTVDLYGADSIILDDQGLIAAWLDVMVDRIGMVKIVNPGLTNPTVTRYDSPKGPGDSGVTGFILITTSHISIHTYPLLGFAAVDIFSCKRFDLHRALDEIKEMFKPERWGCQVHDRGLEFPGIKP